MAAPSRFEATSHQVGHLIREIESAIREVLQTIVPPVPRGTESAHEKWVWSIVGALDIPDENPVGATVRTRTPRPSCSHGTSSGRNPITPTRPTTANDQSAAAGKA